MRGKNYNAGLRGGLFEAQHYARMGQAVWLYGWLILRETRERNGIGFVLGGRPVSYRDIEEETGFERKTLQRWMQVLRQRGYIETTTAPGGIIVRIQKAKKFLWQGGKEGPGRFQQVRIQDEGNLWKSPKAPDEPLLKFGAPPLKNEEGRPQICGRAPGERAENVALAGGINRGTIERQIEKNLQFFPKSPVKTITAADSSDPQRSHAEKKENLKPTSRVAFAALEECAISSPERNVANVCCKSPRSSRDEAVMRELRVGAGPEMTR